MTTGHNIRLMAAIGTAAAGALPAAAAAEQPQTDDAAEANAEARRRFPATSSFSIREDF